MSTRPSSPPTPAALPADDAHRATLHNEVHARPTARIRVPALVIYVAVLNEGVSREEESAHLRRLPGQQHLASEQLTGNFLRLRFATHTVKWERHTEFTRYSIVQHLPEQAYLGASRPDLRSELVVPADWLAGIPGRTIAAIELAMVHGDLSATEDTLALAQQWFGDGQTLLASMMGNNSHSWAVSDFMIRPDGFERMLVITRPGMSPERAGRISQRLLELETYRLMALQGLPMAKTLGPELGQAERTLLQITGELEGKGCSDEDLLERLVALATRVERATAEHAYRISATRAYDAIVSQRLAELREKPIPGTQTMGEFLRRRLSPAMTTVDATARRLESLAERISRASGLLRTRVDIATEEQNRQLLEKLTRGQELQLRLQTTVEGLSIAAISYYVITLLLYSAKALKAAGAPINPELAAGACVPLVLWGVWRMTQRIHRALRKAP